MQVSTFTVLLATLALGNARDAGKFMKTVPTISNSLVNLGKMEITFHLNGRQQDISSLSDHNAHTEYFLKQAAEECPCNNFKPPPFLSDPSEIINKILKSNDLFKNPTSAVCCESSEHLQDGTVIFEVNSNHLPTFNAPKSLNSAQALPNILRAPIFPSFIPFTPADGKPKTVEVFMFPSQKNDLSFDLANFLKPKKIKDTTILKSDLQVIRDREQKKPSASVKKDLTLSEKKNEETTEVTKEGLHTDAPPVTNVMNAL